MTESHDSDWACIKTSTSYKVVAEAELVLIAMGIEARIQKEFAVWRLYTAPALVPVAREQLSLYYWENHLKRPMPRGAETIDSGWAGVCGFLAVIWGVFILEQWGAIGQFVLGNSTMAAGLVQGGELWRTVTALTLHGDFTHILANSVFGLMFGIFCGRLFGSGLAWLLILVCAACGNWLNAIVRPEEFVSIGASTATFAAAGLGSAFNWRRFRVRRGGFRENFSPIAGVIALFFFAGIGTERTDVIAHMTGLLCGLIGGALVSGIDIRRLGASGQWIAGSITLLTVYLSWSYAL